MVDNEAIYDTSCRLISQVTGALQRSVVDARDYRTLTANCGQQGYLRHLPPAAVHQAAFVSQPQQADITGGVVNNGIVAVRWRSERGPDGVPDEPGAVPAHTLPARRVRTGRFC
ncbi:hypothetical protein evm_014531 [Chilo suppressalis]|nr:hypothetical protein evm_014531 [Chilo suppressalis]